MIIGLKCRYCGVKIEMKVKDPSTLKGKRCSVCGDTDFEIKDLTGTKVDYYLGSPPFPDKEVKEEVKD
jgi:transcription elongation factor Elf1